MDETLDRELLAELEGLSMTELESVITSLPQAYVGPLLEYLGVSGEGAPAAPLAQGRELDPGYVSRPHLEYLSDRLALAVADVERGQSRNMVVSMPPRSGKTQLSSVFLPIWLLRKHPDWKIGLISHSPNLATAWGRQVRRLVENHGADLGLSIAKDAGAVGEWETTAGGGVLSRSVGESVTGYGFRALLIDDPTKDFAAAHSEKMRDSLWDWWKFNAVTRLEPPSLVVATGTRWHEDDILGRILSTEYEGDPEDWEEIRFPAIAEENDVLGRSPGQPLYSPLVDESEHDAIARWDALKRTVGSMSWAALYQQRPAPAKGAIFDVGWWRYWTTDPSRVTEDGKVVLFDPSKPGRWIDSWDTAFKGTGTSDFVVGQRWVRQGPHRFLVAQQRGRWTFTETLERMRRWARSDDPASPYGHLVHERLVEEAANGAAIIDTLREEVSGVKPVKAVIGKEARARAITPEIESGNVFLPLPVGEYSWVEDLLAELRGFPNASTDDQVDSLTQALNALRDSGRASITVPGRSGTRVDMSRGRAALTSVRRGRGPGGR